MDDTDINTTQTLDALANCQPAAPAIHVPGRTSLTYADLGAQIRYMRERLGSWGIVRSDVIAGVIPSRPEMAVAWATVPAAATFAPLSPASTSDGYCELLARLQPKALIVPKLDHPLRVAARRCGVAEIELGSDPAAPAGMFTLELARRQESLHRGATSHPEWAYLVTTSGTTGRPKIVPISHCRVALHAQSQGDWLRLTANDVACLMMPLHTGAARISPLLRGASFACLPESDIDGFFRALDEYQITWFNASPTFQRAILRRAPDYREVVARNKLRVITVGSGRLEPEEIDQIEQTFGVPVLVFFGMTEAGIVTRTPSPPGVRKRGSVGVPLCNQVAVMSEERGICPTGAGEVVVRGPLVFDGYIDDAQATAAAFVDGWFRTGDLGAIDEDGYLFLRGRVKDIINRGGEKISPVEIDAAIEAIPGVRAASTFAIPHPSLGEEVAAAVVRDDNATIAAADIIHQVRRRLGPTRVPRKIYFVTELPRTDGGKVRRSELPRFLELDQGTPNESAVQAPAPISALEAALAGLWSSVLQSGSVGVDDDFFLLGGDSLRGARLLTSVKAVFGVELTIQALFGEAATVAGMSRAIEAARSTNATVDRG